MKIENKKRTKDLFEAILLLQSLGEAKKFFRDLLTEKELEEFSNRWFAAQMLAKNEKYTVIEKKTGLSSTTVARISKWLNNGRNGYKLILNRLQNTHHHTSSSVEKGLF